MHRPSRAKLDPGVTTRARAAGSRRPGTARRAGRVEKSRRPAVKSGNRAAVPEAGETLVRLALTVALVGAWAAAQAGPSNWLWGMNLLRYYPDAFGVLVTIAGLIAIWFLPPLRTDGALSRRLAGAAPWGVALVAGGVATTLFHLFRTESFLLGDGLELIRRLHQGEVPAPRSPLYNSLAPDIFRAFSAGDLGRAAQAAGVPSFIAGFLGVAIAGGHLARVARRDAPGAVTAAAFLFLCGAMQLFFGYVEVYALPGAATLVFLGAAFDRMSGGGRGPLASATLALVVGLLSHPFAVTLLPAWIALFFVRADGEWRAPDRRTVVGVVIGGGGVLAALSILFALWPEGCAPGAPLRYLAPQVHLGGFLDALGNLNRARPWADYGSLSLRHAADSWNAAFLAGGAALAALLALLASGTTRALARRPYVAVPLAGLLGIVLFRVLWRTPLGAVRDWDLFAGLGFGVAGAAAGFALAGAGRRMAPAVTAAGLTLLVPWIGIQIDSGRSARRHFDMIDAAPRPAPAVAALAHGAMGDRFASLGNFELAERAYLRSLELAPRHEYAWRLGMALYAHSAFPEAIRALDRALELRPDDRATLVTLGEVLVSAGDAARADTVLARARRLYPEDGAAWLQTARAHLAAGESTEARRALEEADRRMAADDALRPDFRRVEEALNAAEAPAPGESVSPGPSTP